MKILLIAPLYFPVVGGAETYVRMLAGQLALNNHEVIVLTDRRNVSHSESELLDGVLILRTSRYQEKLANFLSMERVLWEDCFFGLFEDCNHFSNYFTNIDIIHAHCLVSIFLGTVLSHAFKAPLFYTSHETTPEVDFLGESKLDLFFRHMPYSKVIAGSKFFEFQALKSGASRDKVTCIYHGIDTLRFHPSIDGSGVRNRLNLVQNQFLVTSVGRFKHRKRQEDLIDAIADLGDRKRDIFCLLVGSYNAADISYYEKLKEKMTRLGLEKNVSLWKDVPDYLLPHIYAASDIYVQPSAKEGLGIAALEAQSSGTPVIATNVEGLNEIIIHNQTGLLVEKSSPEQIASAILALVDDALLRNRLISAGLQNVRENFDLTVMTKQILDEYAKAAS